MSNWLEMTISAPNRPNMPIYVGRDADGEITNHIIVAKTKTDEIQQNEGQKRPKKTRLDIHSFLLRKSTTKNRWKENSKIKYKPQ